MSLKTKKLKLIEIYCTKKKKKKSHKLCERIKNYTKEENFGGGGRKQCILRCSY